MNRIKIYTYFDEEKLKEFIEIIYYYVKFNSV